MYTFAGGCVTYQFSFVTGAAPSLAIPIDTAIAPPHRPAEERNRRSRSRTVSSGTPLAAAIPRNP